MDKEETMREAVALLSRLIETPRVSREEKAAADIMQAQMCQWGLEPRREGNNLWCVAPGYRQERPTLLLNAHLDTVRPAASWTRDPHRAVVEGDRLYGLGSNDDGASLVCLLQTFRALSHRPQAYNLVYLASAEEEVSGRGGVEHVMPMLPPITVGLVGEPTGMQPATCEKGLMVLDVTAHGRSGHAARDEGDNAIYHALEDMAWVRDYRFPRVSPMLGPVKMTVTIVNSGTQHNVIPDRCTYTIDVRSNECYTNVELLDLIGQHLSGDVQARSTRLGSSHISQDHPLVQRAMAMGRTPFGSPTLSDQALMPFPTLKMGPGDSRRSHTADEYIGLTEMEQAMEMYVELLDGLQLD